MYAKQLKLELSKKDLDKLVLAAKVSKTTFTAIVSDPGYIVNASGVAYPDSNLYDVGFIRKVYNNDTNLDYLEWKCPPFVVMSKDIITLSKGDGPIFLNFNMSNFNLTVPDYICSPTSAFKLYPANLIDSKLFLMIGTIRGEAIIENLELTNNPDFIEMTSMKAEEGGKIINLDGECYVFLSSTMVNVNKGDRVFISVYYETNTVRVVSLDVFKPKKKCVVNTIFRIINDPMYSDAED